MKTILFPISALLLFAVPLSAEQKTLFDSNSDLGGFGGPTIKITSIMDESSVLMGGRGGGVINSSFTVGGGGYGLANNINLGTFPDYEYDLSLHMGYGGLELGYIFNSDEVIHFTIYCLAGGGGVTIGHDPGKDTYGSDKYWYDVLSDGFLVLEPTASIELNLTQFFRIEIGASYRYIDGLENKFVTDDDIDGLSGVVSFKFGKFEGLLDGIFD